MPDKKDESFLINMNINRQNRKGMKKKIIYSVIAIVVMALSAFLGKEYGGNKQEAPTVENSSVKFLPDGGLLEDVGLDAVEHFISTDREGIYLLYGDYVCKWFETTVELRDKLNEDPDGKLLSVTNVFQVQKEIGSCTDVKVIIYTHNADGQTVVDVHSSFWVEDNPMNDDTFNINFQQAFDKAMQSNFVKPNSRYIVLRKEVGPNACAPQYIFGNSHLQIYVDSFTGEVTTDNPVYAGWELINAEGEVKICKPLGEWP